MFVDENFSEGCCGTVSINSSVGNEGLFPTSLSSHLFSLYNARVSCLGSLFCKVYSNTHVSHLACPEAVFNKELYCGLSAEVS